MYIIYKINNYSYENQNKTGQHKSCVHVVYICVDKSGGTRST